MKIIKQSEWFATEGGPFVFFFEKNRHRWRGAGAGAEEEGNDYLRACAVDSYTGMIEAGGSFYFVLGDEPLATMAVETDIGVLFVRWRWGNDSLNITRCLDDIFREKKWRIECTGADMEKGAYLFQDAAAGQANGIGYRIMLQQPVRYIENHLYEHDDENAFLITAFLY